MKINADEWLNTMEDIIVSSLGAELGTGWVLIMDNAPSQKAKTALEWCDGNVLEPGQTQLSRHTRHVKRHAIHNTKTDTLHHSADIGRDMFKPACSFGLNPLDTWARKAVQGGSVAGLGCCAFFTAL